MVGDGVIEAIEAIEVVEMSEMLMNQPQDHPLLNHFAGLAGYWS